MADKAFKVSEGTAWHERTVTPSEGTAWHERTVKVTEGTTWYENYPRAAYYTQLFDCTWTQSYEGDGTALYRGTFWKDDIVIGETTNYRGLMGFDKSKIQTFISGGTVTGLRLLINLRETSVNGKPDLQIGKYTYSTYPSTYTGQGDWGDLTAKQFPNNGVGGYWVTLKPTQATLADGVTAISCLCFRAATATAEDMAYFNGRDLGGYISKLEITVLK
jgi:hypothetical protein